MCRPVEERESLHLFRPDRISRQKVTAPQDMLRQRTVRGSPTRCRVLVMDVSSRVYGSEKEDGACVWCWLRRRGRAVTVQVESYFAHPEERLPKETHCNDFPGERDTSVTKPQLNPILTVGPRASRLDITATATAPSPPPSASKPACFFLSFSGPSSSSTWLMCTDHVPHHQLLFAMHMLLF
ncbi:hypothetical protein LIA77_09157 [Sarocladium implicatum]|nr:hypothetical protein LIA77_09157 [Sarocladium implicatum]